MISTKSWIIDNALKICAQTDRPEIEVENWQNVSHKLSFTTLEWYASHKNNNARRFCCFLRLFDVERRTTFKKYKNKKLRDLGRKFKSVGLQIYLNVYLKTS